MSEFEKMIKSMFAGIVCSCSSCEDCKEIFGIQEYQFHDECPLHTYENKAKLFEFSMKVYEKLIQRIHEDEELPFPKDWNEDDIINLIMEMK